MILEVPEKANDNHKTKVSRFPRSEEAKLNVVDMIYRLPFELPNQLKWLLGCVYSNLVEIQIGLRKGSKWSSLSEVHFELEVY